MILFIIKGSALNRGMNTGIENLAWGLARKGLPIHILSGGSEPESHSWPVPENVTYHFTGVEGTPQAHFRAYRELFAERQPEFVIGWLRFLLPIARALPTGPGRPTLIVNQGSMDNRYRGLSPVRRKVNRIYDTIIGEFAGIDKIDALVAISNAVKQNITDVYGASENSIRVIHRGINVDFWAPQEPNMNRTRPKFVRLIYSGNIEPAKGLTAIVKAMSQCRYPIELVLCGPRDDRYLQKLNAILGENSHHRLVFYDRLSPVELRTQIHLSDIFVFLSRSEGLGKSLLEAMACGLPAVVSDHPAFLDVVTDGENALVAPADDATASASAIDRLSADAALRQKLGNNARQTICERFSQELEVEQWHNLLLSKQTGRIVPRTV